MNFVGLSGGVLFTSCVCSFDATLLGGWPGWWPCGQRPQCVCSMSLLTSRVTPFTRKHSFLQDPSCLPKWSVLVPVDIRGLGFALPPTPACHGAGSAREGVRPVLAPRPGVSGGSVSMLLPASWSPLVLVVLAVRVAVVLICAREVGMKFKGHCRGEVTWSCPSSW